ncbi:MAG: tetratricopeptide repeat protein [Gemmataceae bacterium]|nr:tetratricopeptide repeat protein [Gemmataceae bacterium]
MAGQAVELRSRLHHEYPDRPPDWQALASAQALHGSTLTRLGRFPEAEAALASAVDFQQRIVGATDTRGRREELAVFVCSLAWLRLRRSDRSVEIDRLLTLLTTVGGAWPDQRHRLAMLGLAHYRLGNRAQAVDALLRGSRAGSGDRPPDPAATDDFVVRHIAAGQEEEEAPALNAFCLAMAYYRLGRAAEAGDSYRCGLRLSRTDTPRSNYRTGAEEALRTEAAVLGTLASSPSR